MIFVDQFDLSLLHVSLPCMAPKRFARAQAHIEAGDEPPPILLLKRKGGKYDIYDGLNRIAAARLAGKTHLPAVVCETIGEAVRERHGQAAGRDDLGGYWVQRWQA